MQTFNPPITSANFKYIPSTQTDIAKTFAKFGFVPPSQQKNAGGAQ